MQNLWTPDNGDGTFTNPVIYADYSDPDVIRVGDTYYMTASSFNYCPGLPILISKDLINWELVNYATGNITDNSVNNYDIPQHSRGIWAPAIRYNNGTFYIFYGMPDEGYYVVETKDPLGEWSEPHLLLRGKGLIDPCPVWDGDRAYVVHGYAKSRIGFKSFLGIFEMTPDCRSVIGDDRILYDGLATNHTIEGPKVYKKGEYFYILAPAGGVKTGWQTALRSKSIYGPFEEEYVLATGDTIINGPHQGALVDDVNGDEWFVHFQDRGLYGRITHVQPVRFVDGWPVMGEGENTPAGPEKAVSKYCGQPVITYKKPACADSGSERLSLQASDDFSGDRLALQWQWTGNGYNDYYQLGASSSEKFDGLRLFALNPSKDEEPTIWRSANVLTQKMITPFFEVSTEVDFTGLSDDEQTGLVMMGGEYAYIAIRQAGGCRKLVLVEAYTDNERLTTVNSMTTAYVGEKTVEICSIPEGMNSIKLGLFLASDGSEQTKNPLRADASNLSFAFFYQDINGKRVEVPTAFFPSDHTWVGAKAGIFTLALDDKEHGGHADFLSFDVLKL